MNPEDKDMKVVLYSNRAQCYLNLKDYHNAEKDALSALRLDKTHGKSLFRHGLALYRLKKYKEAKREYNNLLKVDPKNKNGLEYLRHTDQKLANIKREAYDKLYYGEIIGDSTRRGNKIIPVEEINMDPKLKKQVEEEESKKQDATQDTNTSHVKEIPKQGVKESDKPQDRESKHEFLSKTDVSNITRNKENTKDVNEFVEDANEEEELKRLEEERKAKGNKKGKKGKKKGKKNKGKNNVENQGEDSNQSTTKPKIKFALDDKEDDEDSEKVPSNEHKFNVDGLAPNGDTDLRITLEDEEEADSPNEQTVTLESGAEKLDFAHAHEIRTERESSPIIRQMKEECEKVKENYEYDEEEEKLEVVKSDEGRFYSLKCSKPPPVKSILKSKSCMSEMLSNVSDRSGVLFDLEDNEIRDFKKNDKVNWPLSKTRLSNYNPKNKNKNKKKAKGKGKNRAMTDEEAKEKERQKIEKARKKREEREQLEMEVAEEEEEDNEDFEECNAPSTRKSRSQPISDAKSPFHGDSLLAFSDTSIPDLTKSVSVELEVPTKSAQLERDLRSMKDDLEAQRNYLQRIEPKDLPNIFKSSIETDEVLKIASAFNSGSKKWVNDNASYLISFLYHLTKVDRFGMAVEF